APRPFRRSSQRSIGSIEDQRVIGEPIAPQPGLPFRRLSRRAGECEFRALNGSDSLQEWLRLEGSVAFTSAREYGCDAGAFRRCRGHDDSAERTNDRLLGPPGGAILLDRRQSLPERHGTVRLVEEDQCIVADESGVDRRDTRAAPVAAEQEA